MQLASVLRNDMGCLVPMCRFALALDLGTFMSLNNVIPSLLSKCYLLKKAENLHSTVRVTWKVLENRVLI